jgi:hypothetical protein
MQKTGYVSLGVFLLSHSSKARASNMSRNIFFSRSDSIRRFLNV